MGGLGGKDVRTAPGAPTWHLGPGRSGQRPAGPDTGTHLSVGVASPPWYTYCLWLHLVLDPSAPIPHPLGDHAFPPTCWCVPIRGRPGRLPPRGQSPPPLSAAPPSPFSGGYLPVAPPAKPDATRHPRRRPPSHSRPPPPPPATHAAGRRRRPSPSPPPAAFSAVRCPSHQPPLSPTAR